MPVESASIPIENAKEFSINCLECSKELWKEVETLSDRKVNSNDLPEKIFNTPKGYFEVVEELNNAQEILMEQ